MPIFAAMGCACTVLDYSEAQIASEVMVAEREGYEIRAVRADMTRPLPFEDGAFDLIFHPVSNCYVEEVLPLARVLPRAGAGRAPARRAGQRLQLRHGRRGGARRARPCRSNPLRDPSLIPEKDLPEWGMQFSHTLDEQIRGQILAGLRILDLYEDTNGEGRLHELGIPTFWATCAEKLTA